MEEWRDVIGYEGSYQVSNLGRIKSLDRIISRKDGKTFFKKGGILSIAHNKRVNIYEVPLSIRGKRKMCKIHRLVADAFIPNDDPNNKITVNHIDGNRSNNKAENLEWTSYSENLKHAYDKLSRTINATKNKKTKCFSKSIIDGAVYEYESIAEASRKTGISETQIRRLINKECVNKKYEFYR